MEAPEGLKRYGAGVGFGGLMLGMQAPLPTDSDFVATAKLAAIIVPVLAPILMDGFQKIAKAVMEIIIAWKAAQPQINAAAQVAAAVTAVIPPAEPPKV